MFKKNCCMDFNMSTNDCCDRDPVIEPVINKCIEREFCHQVNHVCPVHTHVINKHIYNHTYTPEYTCSEENQIINNDPGCCAKFMNNGF